MNLSSRKLFFISFLMMLHLLASQGANSQSVNLYGTSNYESSRSIIVGPDNNYYLTGTTGTSSGNKDGLITKLSPSGEVIWSQKYGGSGDDEITDIMVTKDSAIIFVGYSTSSNWDGWIVKIDTAGNVLWSKKIGGSGNEFLRAIYQTTDSSFLIGAATTSYGGGNYDAWFIKLDKTGSVVWTKTLGGGSTDYGMYPLELESGNYLFTFYCQNASGSYGAFDWNLVKFSSNGSILEQRKYGSNNNEGIRDFKPTGTGNFWIIGETSRYSVGKGMIITVDSSGDQVSRKIYQTSSSSHLDFYTGYPTRDSGLIVAGYLGTDAIMIKLDKALDVVWTKTYIQSGNQLIWNSRVTNDNNYLFCGYSSQTGSNGGQDILLIKTDSNGLFDCKDHDYSASIFTPSSGVFSWASMSLSPSSGGSTSSYSISQSAFSINRKSFQLDQDSVPLNLDGGLSSLKLCYGDSVRLDASGLATSWLWSDGSKNSYAYAKTPGNISVYAERPYCYNADTAEIVFYDSVKVSSGYDTLICNGQAHTFNVTGSGGRVTGHSYTWHDSSNNQIVGYGSSFTDTFYQQSTLKVTLWDSCMIFKDSAYFKVRLKNPLQIIVPSDTTICKGEWVNFHARATGGDSTNYSFNWQNGWSTSDTLERSFDTTTWLTILLSDGCSIYPDTGRFRVTTRPRLELSTNSDTTVCVGQTVSLRAYASGGDSSYSYSWNQGLGSGSEKTDTLMATSTYRVIVTDGCTADDDTAFITVYVRQPLNVTERSDTTVCQGEEFALYASGTGGDSTRYVFTWNSGIDSGRRVRAQFDTSIQVRVILSDACTLNNDTGFVNVTVRDYLSLSLPNDTTLCKGQSIQIQANANGGNSATYVYSWDNGLGAGSSKNITPSSTKTYQVKLTDNCSIVADSSSITITIKPPLDIMMRSDTTICRGESVYLYANATGGDSSAYVYTWNQGISTGQNPIISPTHTSTYRVIVTDNCTVASDTAFVTIYVRDSLSVILPADTTICRGESYVLRANSFGGLLNAHTLTWNQSLGSDSIHSVSPNYTSFYQVILKDNCTILNDTASITVTVRDSLSVTPRLDTTICKGESVWLNANSAGGLSSNHIFTWNQSLGTGQSKQVSPDSTIQYRVILKDNCTVNPDTGYTTITVRAPLNVSARADTTICIGQSVLLNTSSSGGYSPQHEYTWNNGVGTGNYLSVSPNSSTRYQVILKDYCTTDSDTDFIDIIVRSPLSAILRSDTTICVGENVHLWAFGLGGDSSRFTFTWNQGLDTGRSQSIAPDTTTIYQLILSDACTIKDDTATVTIHVRPPLEIIERSDTFICVGEQVRLYAEARGGNSSTYRYDWDSGLDTGNGNLVVPLVTKTYQVILSDGCTTDDDTGFVTVFVRKPLTLIKRSDSTICKGEEVELYFDGTGGDSLHYSFIWDNAGGTGNYRKVSPDSSLTYIVHLKDNCTLAAGIDSVEITVRPPLGIVARLDSTVCVGEGILLYSSASGGYAPNYELDWNQGIGVSNAPLVFPDSSIDYQVIIRDYCTVASDTDTVHIAVRPPLEVTPRLDTMICVGESVSLYALGIGGLDTNFIFSWNQSLDTGQQNIVYPDTTTDYQVVLSDACTIEPDTGIVRINVRMPLEVTPRSDTLLCVGESVRLYAGATGGDSTYYYRWNNNADTVDEPNVSPDTTLVYEVIVRDQCTLAPDTATIIINVRPPLSVIARQDTLLCRGESVLVDALASGGDSITYEYTWDSGVGIGQSFISTPDSTQSFRVIIKDYCTVESDTDYITINTRDALHIEPRTDTTICIGQSVDIYGLSSGGVSSAYSFTWNQGLSGLETHTVSPSSTTNYQVILKDGCTVIEDTAAFIIRIRQPLALTVRTDTFICQGEQLILYAEATGGDSLSYTYTWNQGIGVADNPLVGPSINTNYFVTITDNCTTNPDTGSVNIELPVPLKIQKSNDTLICRNDPVILQVSGTGGLINQYVFNWQTLGAGATKTVSPGISETYIVEFNDQCALPVTDSIRVNVQVPLVPGFEFDPEWACVPNDITFDDTTSGSLDSWFNWEFGDGTSDTGINLKQVNHSFDPVGVYPVRLILKTQLGCLDTSYWYEYIVHKDPIASFSYGYDDKAGTDMTIKFTNTSKGGQDYYWDYGDMESDELIENPSHAYQTPMLYPVILTVVNEWGCVDSTADTLDVKDVFRVFVPNAFSPGVSDTLNSTFGPIGTGIGTFRLIVFNRWGEQVYSTDSSEFWTGINELSNEPAPIGYYVYIMTVYSTRDVKKTVKGSVYILK